MAFLSGIANAVNSILTTGSGTTNGIGIPNEDSARYPSLQGFMGNMMKKDDNSPSFTNLFSVNIATPRCMRTHFGSDRFRTETGDLGILMDYYANNLSLPSKQITTGTVVNVGSPWRYATGTAFSQFNINFIMPRSQYTRNFFERWTQVMAPDQNQYVGFQDENVSPVIRIYKWERGGGDAAALTDDMRRAIAENPGINYSLARYYKVTACWELQNCFPYNIGTVQLNNSAATIMNLTIGFYYERYRFYPEERFDDYGIRNKITIPSDDYWNGAGDGSSNAITLWDVLGSTINSFII
tara:strand:+ start:356 stop:1246 length:891 start_codon:yes stop_codon:yes gene_type:complete